MTPNVIRPDDDADDEGEVGNFIVESADVGPDSYNDYDIEPLPPPRSVDKAPASVDWRTQARLFSDNAARALDAKNDKAVCIVGQRESSPDDATKIGTNENVIPIIRGATEKASLAALADRARREHI
ncbi:hypothetical protein F4859DRAFT_516789 [Xylaria cf. heliscus]|nr:hypothetical protein F4859DRAFT_516789 [Xylaria cf. heliscus]